jgi:hypothetical protein
MARGRWYSRDERDERVARAREAGRTAATEVQRILDERGLDAALAHHHLLRRDSAARHRFSEQEFNDMGYALLGAGDAPTARAIFRSIPRTFPAPPTPSTATPTRCWPSRTRLPRRSLPARALLGSSDSLAENRTLLERNARRFLATRQ